MTANIAPPSFDWLDAFSPENIARTIENCKLDSKNWHDLLPNDNPSIKKAAVLVPLCYDILGRPSILYNLRSFNLSKHRGEISFPGGSMDPEDLNSPINTALRETEEELGLSRKKVDVWTLLQDFPTVTATMRVTPVLGFISGLKTVDPTKMKINPEEVDHAFTVTLEHLCDPRNWEEMRNERFNLTIPAFKNLNVRKNNKTIELWGLTAIITHVVLRALLPNVYKRNIAFPEPPYAKL